MTYRHKVAPMAILLPLLFLLSLTAYADGFAFIPNWGTDGLWLSAPSPDSTSQVWFRRQYHFSQRPANAYVIIATTGYAEPLCHLVESAHLPHHAEKQFASGAGLWERHF